MNTVIRNITVVNEGREEVNDVLIEGERIGKIAPAITVPNDTICKEIRGDGLFLLPGMIDAQVHFREPGLTWKGTIYSESKAALAGGITSFMEMPNTRPATMSLELLEEKFTLASNYSWGNYSFFMGLTKENADQALRINNATVCGVSDDGLYFDSLNSLMADHPDYLERFLRRSGSLVALHSEKSGIIRKNTAYYKSLQSSGEDASLHSRIHSTEGCVAATKDILDVAYSTRARVHLLHISTGQESALFDNDIPLPEKRITAEACLPHLYFSQDDYPSLGHRIKWNPSVKTPADRQALFMGLHSSRLDFIATDHAPHLLSEKQGDCFTALSGGPLVQHALPALVDLMHQGKISIRDIARFTAHNVAEAYRVQERGYIREGYYADLILVDALQLTKVGKDNLLYKCGWSPFEGKSLRGAVVGTFVNGNLMFCKGKHSQFRAGHRLAFSKIRH